MLSTPGVDHLARDHLEVALRPVPAAHVATIKPDPEVGQASLLAALETRDLCLRGHARLQLRHQLHTPHQLRHQATLFP